MKQINVRMIYPFKDKLNFSYWKWSFENDIYLKQDKMDSKKEKNLRL